jgi:hypothetical protein
LLRERHLLTKAPRSGDLLWAGVLLEWLLMHNQALTLALSQ